MINEEHIRQAYRLFNEKKPDGYQDLLELYAEEIKKLEKERKEEFCNYVSSNVFEGNYYASNILHSILNNVELLSYDIFYWIACTIYNLINTFEFVQKDDCKELFRSEVRRIQNDSEAGLDSLELMDLVYRCLGVSKDELIHSGLGDRIVRSLIEQGASFEREQSIHFSRIREGNERLLEAPLLWVNRDKTLKQEPHEFIQATYFDVGHDIDRAALRKLDRTLLLTLESRERTSGKDPPQDFIDQFPRKEDALDAQVARVKETGEKPKDWAERMRLEQAARRRGTTLAKD